MLFMPIVVVLTFCIVAAIATKANVSSWSRSQHFGLLAYSWNAFIMSCMVRLNETK